jgi:phosphate transport system permease protein
MTPAQYTTMTRWISRLMFGVCVAFTLAILALLLLVTGYLVTLGAGSLSLEFFTREPTFDPHDPGGMLHALQGTGILIFIASAIGIPLGLLAGVYLAEYDLGSPLAAPIRFISDVLAGVPSIVIGIIGYELLVRPLGNFNGWAGAAALAFIMIPIISRTTEEMLRLVPNSYREASMALGATKSGTILKVVLPSATGSVVTGVMLAIARVAGETAPLLFTALNNTHAPIQFDRGGASVAMNEPFPSLTVQIYKYATGPVQALKEQAWAGILVLISLIFLLNLTIRLVARKRKSLRGSF